MGFGNKKKKSFLQKAKKFGKQGKLGKGKNIDQDTYDYFVRVLDNLRDGFDDDEAKEMFVGNVFEQTVDEEVNLCGNQLVSRVIEQLLPLADFGVRKRFMTVLGNDLRITCTDAFASHVLEKLLMLSSFRSAKAGQLEDDEREFNKSWLQKVARFAINNFDDFAFNMYASHLFRTSFQCLSGSILPEDVLRSKRSRTQTSNEKSEELKSIFTKEEIGEDLVPVLEDAAQRITGHKMVMDFISEDAASGVIQALILAMGKVLPKSCKKLCKHLLEAMKDQQDRLTESESFCRTLEVMMALSTELPKIFKSIYETFYHEKLVTLAKHPIANFSVQKLITNCHDKEMFEKWYESEFDANLEDIFSSGSSGVVLAITKACTRLKAKQGHFLVSLMKSFHCFEPASLQTRLVPLLVRLMTKETADAAEENPPINLHGSLIVQELLTFNKPIKVITSLLEMKGTSLRELLSDPRGSHITDAFMESPTIGEKSREGLVKALQGELVSLACSKHGSRSLDAIWKKSSPKFREIVASELSAKESTLNSNQFGRFISQNYALSTFKRNRSEWQQGLTRDTKKRKMFDDIIGDFSTKKAKAEGAAQIKSEHKKSKKTEEEDQLFVIDKQGDGVNETKEEPTVESPPKKHKKKKAKAKSYLDDL